MKNSSTLSVFQQQSSTTKVAAGNQIKRGKYGAALTGGAGTAGLIVRRRGSATGAWILTCAHVLGVPAFNPDTAATDDLVYSPEYVEKSNIACNKPFGRVVTETLQSRVNDAIQAKRTYGVVDYGVDAALVEVSAGVQALNVIPEIGKVAGVRDLIAEWGLTTKQAIEASVEETFPDARKIQVRKYGRTTFYSEGTLVGFVQQKVIEFNQPGNPESQAWVLQVKASPTQKLFEREFEPDMGRYAVEGFANTDEILAYLNAKGIPAVFGSPSKKTIKISTRVFSMPGDSGSPVVDKNNQVIGILASGTKLLIFEKGGAAPFEVLTGHSQVILIRPALDLVNADFLPEGQQAAGALVVVPGQAVERGGQEALDWAALDQLEAAFLSHPAGAGLAALFRSHLAEVRQLIHHRRHVTAIWYRHKGPGFMAAIMKSAQAPDIPIPVEIDGIRLVDALRALLSVLLREGSEPLGESIREHEAEFLWLAEQATSIKDVLAALANPDGRLAGSR